ncbi:MAG: hypothetical protein VW397_04220 [Candidatus Margulisiibacteriota bacterium]
MELILILALAFRVVMDICFKMSVRGVCFDQNSIVQGFKQIFMSPIFWFAMLFSAINFCLWIIVLSYYDLSFAYPLFGICFALIMIGGKVFFNETLDKNKIVGIFFILLSSLVLVVG